MLGNPKFNYEDRVKFFITMDGEKIECIGSVFIVDPWGTFEQNEEVSYDIMVDDFKGNKTLFKHVREGEVELC